METKITPQVKIAFASWLTGHDEKTIGQMYKDWIKLSVKEKKILPIVVFDDKKFYEIPEQDNPYYDKFGGTECLLITQSDKSHNPDYTVYYIDPTAEKGLIILGLFGVLKDAQLFAKFYESPNEHCLQPDKNIPKPIKEKKCIVGCKHFTGESIKHHKNCPYYPGSVSEMYDDNKDKLTVCIEALKELIIPKGAYKLDRLEHAESTIKETAKIALETLKKIKEIK